MSATFLLELSKRLLLRIFKSINLRTQHTLRYNRLTDLSPPNNDHWSYKHNSFGRRTRKFNFSRNNKRGTHYAHGEQHTIGEVSLPANAKDWGFLHNGTKVSPDMARVVVKPDGYVRTSFPYNSSHSK